MSLLFFLLFTVFAFPLFITFFLFVLKAPDVLIKCRATQVFRVKSTELLGFLNARTDFFIRIGNLNCGFQMPNDGSQCINTTALVTLLLVAVVFNTSDNLLAELRDLLAPKIDGFEGRGDVHLFKEEGGGVLVILRSA